MGDVHKSVTCSCVFMLVQLSKCVVCGSDLQRGYSSDGCLTSSILFKYESRCGHLFVLSWARVRQVARGVMYCEWYGVCDFVVLLVVKVCAGYGSMIVFHVCLNFSRCLWCWGLCQCLWCSLCCCMLFVSCVWVLFVVW